MGTGNRRRIAGEFPEEGTLQWAGFHLTRGVWKEIFFVNASKNKEIILPLSGRTQRGTS